MPRVRPIDRNSREELELVAARMRLTLIDVLGEERGGSMYTMDWLLARAAWHLDSANCEGEIFLWEADDGHIAGHTIVRIEEGFGLFSTFYVEPESRRKGVASDLVSAGEAWMRQRGMAVAKTYTATNNTPLHKMLERFGYSVEFEKDDMVALSKPLSP